MDKIKINEFLKIYDLDSFNNSEKAGKDQKLIEKKKMLKKADEARSFFSEENTGEIKKIIANAIRKQYKEGHLENVNYVGGLLIDRINEVVEKMDVDGERNSVGGPEGKPKFGWKLYSKHGDGKIGVDPWKRKDLYDKAKAKLEESMLDFFKNLPNMIKITDLKNNDGNLSEGAVKIIASIASLLKIYQYIFLPGHMFNELMKKEKSDDKKGGLSGHGLTKTTMIHLIQGVLEKEHDVIQKTVGKYIDDLIDVIETHFESLNDEDRVKNLMYNKQKDKKCESPCESFKNNFQFIKDQIKKLNCGLNSNNHIHFFAVLKMEKIIVLIKLPNNLKGCNSRE